MPDQFTGKPETIRAAVDAYLQMVREGRSAATTKAYHQGLDHFLRVVAEHGIPESASPGLLTADAFNWMAQALKGKSPATERLYISAVSGFFEFLLAEEVASINPHRVAMLRKSRVRPAPQRFPQFPREAIEKVINYAHDLNKVPAKDEAERLINLRDRALILMLADSGLRIHEACKLLRGEIDWHEARAVIIGKGGKQAVIRFTGRALEALRDYLSARAVLDGSSGKPLASLPLFLRHDLPLNSKRKIFQFRRMTTETGRNIVERRVIECLGAEAAHTITPHSFRHYFVTLVLNATGNLKTAQELARHSSLTTTGLYAHLSNAQLDQAYYEALENRPGEEKPDS